MISGIVSVTRGSTSGRPSPSREVSAMYRPVISRASSVLGTPRFTAAA